MIFARGFEAVEAASSPDPTRRAAAATKPLSQILQPLELDPLSVVDDPDFLAALATQRNLPQFVKDSLPALFG